MRESWFDKGILIFDFRAKIPSVIHSKSLVISIHDVSPITWETTIALLDDLRPLGVTKFSLLIIPDHHHQGHFLENLEFCNWLKERAARGDEIIIHGTYHQRERKLGETVIQKLITRFYTQNEGEYYDLNEESAFNAIIKSQADFNQIGLKPSGFIAPAWLLSQPAEQALCRANCAYTTRIGYVLNLKSGTRYFSQSMVYSVRNAWRRRVSLVWNAFLLRRLQENPLLRIGIHPPDFAHPAIWHQIRESIMRGLMDRRSMTYEEWIQTYGRGD